MTQVPEPRVTPLEYEVSCLPLDEDMFGSAFTIRVEYRGGNRWAVLHNGAYLDADGVKSWGPIYKDGREPVTDEDFAGWRKAEAEWMDQTRFDLEAALALAKRLAPTLKIGPTRDGRQLTVADALARIESGDA